MISVYGNIKLLENSNILNSVSVGFGHLSNISKSISYIKGKSNTSIRNISILGYSKFGDGSILSDSVNACVIAPSTTDTTLRIIMNISTSQSSYDDSNDYIRIYFANNKYKRSSITLLWDSDQKSKEYTSEDGVFIITSKPASISNKKIVALSVSLTTDNSPLFITGIQVGDINYSIDKSNLISMDSTIIDRSDTEKPSYGIIASTGNLSINDFNSMLKKYVELGIFGDDAKVTLNIKNDIVANKTYKIGEYIGQDWSYDEDNKQASATLSNDLVEWQDINIDGIAYNSDTSITQRMSYFYQYLKNKTPSKYNMLAYGDLDSVTSNLLFNTYCQYPILESCTLWQAWTKLCEACGLHIFKDNDNNTICKYIGGN